MTTNEKKLVLNTCVNDERGGKETYHGLKLLFDVAEHQPYLRDAERKQVYFLMGDYRHGDCCKRRRMSRRRGRCTRRSTCCPSPSRTSRTPNARPAATLMQSRQRLGRTSSRSSSNSAISTMRGKRGGASRRSSSAATAPTRSPPSLAKALFCCRHGFAVDTIYSKGLSTSRLWRASFY